MSLFWTKLFKPELQFQETESVIKNKLNKNTDLKGFKFAKALVLVFKKIESHDRTKYYTFIHTQLLDTIINESDIDNILKSIYTAITSNMLHIFGKVSGWYIDSFKEHNAGISK